MNSNISALTEIVHQGSSTILCFRELHTMCWVARQEKLLPPTKDLTGGIYACVASNDLGSRAALTEVNTPLHRPVWKYALG